MQDVTFAFNPNASLKVDSVGCSGTPVIVIDDFGIDPGEVINPDPRTGRLMANIFVDFFPLDKQG